MHTDSCGGYLKLCVGNIHVLFGRCFPSLDQLHIDYGIWQYNRRVGAIGDFNSNPIRQNQRRRRTKAIGKNQTIKNCYTNYFNRNKRFQRNRFSPWSADAAASFFDERLWGLTAGLDVPPQSAWVAAESGFGKNQRRRRTKAIGKKKSNN
jgi:hypothetical protein